MAKKGTKIGWCDYTLNNYGWCCKKISPSCKNCYMFAMAKQYGRPDPATSWYKRKPEIVSAELRSIPSGSSVFLNDMSDTYLDRASYEDILETHQFAVQRPDVSFVICTKRAFITGAVKPPWPDNLWLMVTVESDDYMWRIADALRSGAKHVAVSAEPLLGPLTFLHENLTYEPAYEHGGAKSVEWLIDGGESGNGRRPANVDWFRLNRDTCIEHGVAYFHKQGNERFPGRDRELDGRMWGQIPGGYNLAKAGDLSAPVQVWPDGEVKS